MKDIEKGTAMHPWGDGAVMGGRGAGGKEGKNVRMVKF